MATTTNFGWETPDDTDLVKDGAAAIRTLGGAIDTSLVDLKGGTTGQVLSKASNTDMDFTWTAIDPLTILDAKGDLISATAADTPARLAVGTNGQVLSADSTTSTGLKWITPSGGAGYTLLNAGGTALTGATTITVSGISDQERLMILVVGASSASASSWIRMTFNSDSAANYAETGFNMDTTSNSGWSNYFVDGYATLGRMGDTAGGQVRAALFIEGCKSTNSKAYQITGGATGVNTNQSFATQGIYKGTSAITSISVISSTGNFDAGTIYVYGSAS